MTRVHCAQTAEPIGANFAMSVAPDENSTALKFGNDRFRGWGTMPLNDPAKWSNSRFVCRMRGTVYKQRNDKHRKCGGMRLKNYTLTES